jgi:hypothetical protein
MDNQLKTSFIPRTSIDTSVNFQSRGTAPHKVGRTIFALVGTLILVATIVIYGLTFVWQIKLKKDIVNQVEAMQAVKDNFDEKFVQDASRLNTRIQQAGNILQNHVSPSSLYSLLEDYTLQTVSFSRFSFKDNQDGTLAIHGEGEALRYESIVLQSDAFGKSGYLRNVIFTDLRPNQESGHITFSFEATLDPRLVLYRNSLSAGTNTQSN